MMSEMSGKCLATIPSCKKTSILELPIEILLKIFELLEGKDKFVLPRVCNNWREICEKSLTIDHIIPKQKGGQDTWENLIIACSPCNSKKGNRTPLEAEMKLMKIPKKPNRFMYYNQYISQKNEGWKEYLFQNKN